MDAVKKYENLFELSVKQSVTQSSLASFFPKVRLCFVCQKPNVKVVYRKVTHFLYPTINSSTFNSKELFKSKSNLILFRR